jgi:integrase
VTLFLDSVGDHRFAVALRLGVLHGLGRSEALALRWDDVDTAYGTLRIDEGLIAVRKGAVWSDAKNARSRRVIALDDGTMRAIARRRRQQE